MKSNRMFSIINLLINNKRMTANELAEKLEVSKRTIYIDIEDLNMAGVPVVSFPGQGGGLGVLDNYKLDKKFLSVNELEDILVGLNALKSIETETGVNTLISKLDMENNSEIFENANTFIDLSSWFEDGYLKSYLYEFKNAIRNKKIVMIEYQAKNGFSKRKIEPYKVVFKHSSWYVFAFCLEKKGYRLFKINRIMSVKVLDTSFTVREQYAKNLNLLFESDYFSTNKKKNKFQVTLQYKKEDEDFLMNKIGLRVFSFDSKKRTITFKSTNYSWVIDFIIELKDKVQVINPLYLVEDIKGIIKKINNLYNES
ncbi:MAG: helix-turn-helix transcriptional regulator [Coprobacillaceae bacterium]